MKIPEKTFNRLCRFSLVLNSALLASTALNPAQAASGYEDVYVTSNWTQNEISDSGNQRLIGRTNSGTDYYAFNSHQDFGDDLVLDPGGDELIRFYAVEEGDLISKAWDGDDLVLEFAAGGTIRIVD